mmetsp:Transcript_81496/g.236301  ORF Transcript_81496/g.236301 Transcript_81496/m.236301 type:complete len:200 (-) Transcript_81496:179-778(-)
MLPRVPACLLGCAAALAVMELVARPRLADIDALAGAELAPPEAVAAAPVVPPERQEQSTPPEPEVAAEPPQPEPIARTEADASGVVLHQGRTFLSDEKRRMAGCQPNPCAGLRCPSGWTTRPGCDSCSCQRSGNPCAGMSCRNGWSTQVSGSRCICVCRGGGCQGVPPRCRGVNSGCWINAQCCSGRCAGIHRCRPGLR